jgi:uncharacterized protein YdhG (YjbR/CyaY superfamily)
MTEKFSSVDEYIASFPAEVREALEEVRRTIHAVVPAAGEKISYDIPTITLNGKPLLHFSGWKHHIALYPIPPVDDALATELDQYRSGKSTLKFPLTKPIPYNLITQVSQAFLTTRTQPS